MLINISYIFIILSTFFLISKLFSCPSEFRGGTLNTCHVLSTVPTDNKSSDTLLYIRTLKNHNLGNMKIWSRQLMGTHLKREVLPFLRGNFFFNTQRSRLQCRLKHKISAATFWSYAQLLPTRPLTNIYNARLGRRDLLCCVYGWNFDELSQISPLLPGTCVVHSTKLMPVFSALDTINKLNVVVRWSWGKITVPFCDDSVANCDFIACFRCCVFNALVRAHLLWVWRKPWDSYRE